MDKASRSNNSSRKNLNRFKRFKYVKHSVSEVAGKPDRVRKGSANAKCDLCGKEKFCEVIMDINEWVNYSYVLCKQCRVKELERNNCKQKIIPVKLWIDEYPIDEALEKGIQCTECQEKWKQENPPSTEDWTELLKESEL